MVEGCAFSELCMLKTFTFFRESTNYVEYPRKRSIKYMPIWKEIQ